MLPNLTRLLLLELATVTGTAVLLVAGSLRRDPVRFAAEQTGQLWQSKAQKKGQIPQKVVRASLL